MNLQTLLEGMVKVEASDLHLKVGSPPMLRINGILRPVDSPPIDPAHTEETVASLMPMTLRETLEKRGTVDFAYSIPQVARFRINVFHQRGSLSVAIRLVKFNPPALEELNLPPALSDIADAHQGLVLVTGVTGSGKSSTLAAMIHHINTTRRMHIITVEDPIEYLHRDKRCIINQIEMGVDTESFATALRHILRQDPDIILIGELRDRETVKTVLMAVETGHLVFSTLHTPDAKQTINRILHFFKMDEERLILSQLSQNLRGVISQRLLRRADGKGRLPVCEILVNVPMVSKLIREGRVADIQQVMQNQEAGMQIFDEVLAEKTRTGEISEEEGTTYCNDIDFFRRRLKKVASTGDRSALVTNL